MNTQSTERLSCAAALCATMSLMIGASAHAQSLDEAMIRQLQGDCIGLGTPDGNASGTIVVGPDLDQLCRMSFGSARGTANSGGGGASSQTLAVSVENRRKAQLEEEALSELGSRLGLFVNANGESLDRNPTRFADGFDSSILSLIIGADYRFTQHWLAGIAGAYRESSGDFDAGGDFDTESIGGGLYLSFAPTAEMYFDLSASFADKQHTVNRRAQFTEFDNGGNRNIFDGIVNSETDGIEYGAHAQFGYDFVLGMVTVGPRIGANWTHTEVDPYTETGGGRGTQLVNGIRGAAGLALIYLDTQEADSLQSLVGGQASVSNTFGFGVLVSQANVDYIHEFDNRQRTVNVRFVQDLRATPKVFQYQTDEPEEDYFKVGLSFVLVMKNGIQPFLNLQGMAGNEQFDSYAATLGVRFEL